MSIFCKSFGVFLIIAFAPIIILKFYIGISGDLNARWEVIRYGTLLLIWILFFVVAGIFKGIKAQKIAKKANDKELTSK